MYALDLPGFGDAPEPREPLGMPESGELLAELLAAEGLDRPVLVGHSTGAQAVAETAARHPELVDRLVLIGPTVNPRERTLAKQTARFLQDVAVLNPKVFALGLAVLRRGRAALVRPQPAADARAPHRARAARDRRADARGPRRARPHRAAVLGRGGGRARARRTLRRGAGPRARDHGARGPAGRRAHRPARARRAGRSAGRAARRAAEGRADELAERRSAGGPLDYVYAGWRQLAVLGARRSPTAWRTGDADKPEIVLLPGVYEHWSFLRPLGDALNAAGPPRGDRARPAT